LSQRRRVFPLIPRKRLSGTPFGERRSTRRGHGSDVAGTRPYVPGDPVSTIDWFASARLSSARGEDAFVVRQMYAEEAPRVIVVSDRRASMSLYSGDLPWLSKPAAALAAAEAIARSAVAARAELGHADAAGDHTRVLSPGAVAPRHIVDRVRRAVYDAPPESLSRTLSHLLNRRADLPQGSFVFVLSDFLADVPAGTWSGMRASYWEVVPVVIQDPVWEQSFPDVAGVLIPFASADRSETALVRLSGGDASTLRRENEERLARLLRRFRGAGFDPVLLGSSSPFDVDTTFLRWAERRRRRRR
jgi:uncharacterized protein (DUF58 family)